MEQKTIDQSLQKILDSFDPSKLMTTEQQKAAQEAAEAEQKENIRKERINALAVPKRLKLGREHLSDGNHWRGAFDQLKEAIGTGTIIAIRGKPGTGKSQMAAELLYHGVEEKELTGLFITFTDLQLEVKSTFNTVNSEASVIKRLIKPDMLVIDEFDWLPEKSAEVTDNYWQSILYHIINKRYYDMKDTILTSNKSLDDFKKTTITPIKSRITETGYLVNTDDWTDFRREIPF
jgi:DNA replication protein DnaC